MKRNDRTGQPKVKLNQSVVRVVRILKALAVRRGELSLSEISAQVGLHPSTTYRLLVTLEGEGLVERGSERAGYLLGAEMIRMGYVALASLSLGEEAYPYMRHLAAAAHETVNLGVLRGPHVVYLQKIEAEQPLRADLVVGAFVPAYCTGLGKALLAHLPDSELDALLGPGPLTKYGPNCLTTIAQLREELQRIRQRGYSVDDEEFSAGIRAVGSPIRNHRGQVIAGIAIAGPASRLTLDRIHELAPLVVEAAAGVSRRLGYTPQ